jgi:hypothetical protein
VLGRTVNLESEELRWAQLHHVKKINKKITGDIGKVT